MFSTCSAKSNIKIELKNFNENLDNINNDNLAQFKLTKKHTKKYEAHNYKRDQYIKEDFDTNNITEEKLKNLKYLKSFVKERCIINNKLTKEELIKTINDKYPNL